MTRDADLKRLVRARMASTGENYTTARAALLRQKEDHMPFIPCTVRVHFRSETELAKMVQLFTERSGREPTETEVDVAKAPMVILEEADGPRKLTIFCGDFEARAIQWSLDGIETERPMTHDLLNDVVAAMGQPREVRITELRDTTFYAELAVTDAGGIERAVSCRPSDGVAFGLRAQIPILVNDQLLTVPASQA